MYYTLKTLENFKNVPSLSPLASVRDHSPPTSGGKWSRNGGIGWGYGLIRYDSYYNYIFNKKKQNGNTEDKMSMNNHCTGISVDLNSIAITKLNEFYPLNFRPDQPSAISLRKFFRTNNNVIGFNHNNNFNQREVFYV